MNKMKQYIDKNFSTLVNPNWSILRILFTKVFILMKFISDVLKNLKGTPALYKLKSHKNFGVKSSALVLGNGSMDDELPYQLLNTLQTKKKIYIYGVNFILNSDITRQLRIDFLILSDPETLELKSKNERVNELWENVKKFKPTIFVPYRYHHKLQDFKEYAESIYFFNDLSLETMSHNINPLFPRGYPSSTFFKALALANYAKHEKIFIGGADQSMFKNVQVNDLNRIIQYPSHRKGAEGGHDNYSEGIDITNAYLNGMADYLFDFSNLFMAFKFYFGNIGNTYYLGNSYHDFYPKVTMTHFVEVLTNYIDQ